MNNNPILLPTEYRDANYKDLCISSGKLDIYGKYGLSHITTQELNCIRLLTQGQSYKETAKTLSLSPRTIETYLQRIKLRTGFNNIDKIIEALSVTNTDRRGA